MKSQIIKMDVDENTGEITETVEYVEVAEPTAPADIAPVDEDSEVISDTETVVTEEEIVSSSVSSSVDDTSSVSVSVAPGETVTVESEITPEPPVADVSVVAPESTDITPVEETEVVVDDEHVPSVTIDENVENVETPEVHISVDGAPAENVSVITPEEAVSDINVEPTESEIASVSVAADSEMNPSVTDDQTPSSVSMTADMPKDPTPKADPDDRNDTPAENVPANKPVIDSPVVNDQKVGEEYKPEEVQIVEDGSAIHEDVEQTKVISDTIEELKYTQSSISKYGMTPQAMMLLNMDNMLAKKAGIALPAHESLNSIGRNDEAAQQTNAALEIVYDRALKNFTNKTLQIWNNTTKFINSATNWNKKQYNAVSNTVNDLKKTPWNKVTRNVYMNNIDAARMQNVVTTAIKLVTAVEDVVTNGTINRAEELNMYCDRLNTFLSDMNNIKTTWYKVKGGVTTHLENINVLNNGLLKVSKKLEDIKKSGFMSIIVKTELDKPTREAILSIDNAILSATKALFKTQKLLGAATYNFNLVKKVR